MKNIFIKSLLLVFLVNCYEVSEDVPFLKRPLSALLLNNSLYPKSSNSFITVSSSNLPGTTVMVKKFSDTFYALVEDNNITNVLFLYTSSNGLDFVNTGQSLNLSNIASNGTNSFFSHNSILYFGNFQNINSGSSINFYTYSNNIISSSTINISTGLMGANQSFECIYSYNNFLRIIISINDPATFTYSSNIVQSNIPFQSMTSINNIPGFTVPRKNYGCSKIDSTIFLYGGIRTNCSGATCTYNDLWSSLDGETFTRINSDFQSSTMGSDRIVKLSSGTLIALPNFFAGYKSLDNGITWTSISFITGTAISSPNVVGFSSLGNRVFIYSTTKVYYGTIP